MNSSTASTFIALLKREVLEHKNLWRVPCILLGIALLVKMSLNFGNLAIDFDIPEGFNLESSVQSLLYTVTGKALAGMNFIIMLVMCIVSIFYALSCLFDERQDESVLFWRSLPISDLQTVASKLVVAIVLVPAIVLALQALVAMVFLGTQSADYLGAYLGSSLSYLSKVVLWSMLPTIAWCLVCSQTAKKNPFLMAFVIPILLILVDKLFLSGVISDVFVINRLTGVDHHSPMLLLLGFAFSAVCLGLTIARRGERL